MNRTARPWDNKTRRPSQADRLSSMARQILRAEFPTTLLANPETNKYINLVESLFALCT